jgi:hypothetical protein
MYIVDLLKATTRGTISYSWGWTSPLIVRGKFKKTEIGLLQAKLHKHLLEESGFKRTHWQLIFPGQIAGVVKRVNADEYGGNQYHVRFYIDGVIESEIEFNTFSRKHWSGYRKLCWKHVDQIVDSAPFTDEEKKKLKDFFQTKNYSQPWMTA